jgi:hypothetical protein
MDKVQVLSESESYFSPDQKDEDIENVLIPTRKAPAEYT